MKPSEIVDKALTEVIPTEAAWMQGDYVSTDGSKHCTLGALYYASGVYNRMCDSYEGAGMEMLNATVAKVKQVLLTDFDSCSSVHDWNDANGRTYDEVRAMLEKTRAGLQEAGE